MKTSCKLNRRGRRHSDEPYIQWVFHFTSRNSIDVTSITEEELEWARDKYQTYTYIIKKEPDFFKNRPNHNYCTVVEMFKLWFPEELL